MNNNLQMREYTNGCIIIDAQPCSQSFGGRACFGLQSYATTSLWVSQRTPKFVFLGNTEK